MEILSSSKLRIIFIKMFSLVKFNLNIKSAIVTTISLENLINSLSKIKLCP